jgi:Zonular occludens toxin (Zot).
VIDMTAIMQRVFSPVVDMFFSFIYGVLSVALFFLFLFVLVFVLRYKMYPPNIKADRLEKLSISFLPYDLFRWLVWDFLTRKQRDQVFSEYGFSIFTGRQGAGKTVSMVRYLDLMRKKYPNVKIITNFNYAYADKRMKDWRDFMEIRNGEDGVIFAIDEIHSEYSAASWKDFPEALLSEISMQRKQRVKIVATSQVFCRVAKPIREQAFSVMVCRTYFSRLTFFKEYDAAEYSTSDTPYKVKKSVKPIWKSVFVQSNALRRSFDTYEKIERMKKLDFIPRGERQ